MPNFKKFGEIFLNFEIFNVNNRFFQQVRNVTGDALLLGASICKKVYIFGINMEKYGSLEMGENFVQVLGLLKGQKTPKKCPLYHFFATHEAVLGESIFGGTNGLQIPKFKLF